MDHDNHDRITQHQPEGELDCLDSLDSCDSVSGDDADDHFARSLGEGDGITSARRYGFYRNKYLRLFEHFFDEACELQLSALDGSPNGVWTEQRAEMVDHMIWKLME